AKDGMPSPPFLTLWDLIEPIARRLRPRPADHRPPTSPERSDGPIAQAAPRRNRGTRATDRSALGRVGAARTPAPASTRTPPALRHTTPDRYADLPRDMLAPHDTRVRRWRTSMSGVAWTIEYRDGTVKRLIEAPRPKSPMSAAIFLHEIGHHAIGLDVYKPR